MSQDQYKSGADRGLHKINNIMEHVDKTFGVRAYSPLHLCTLFIRTNNTENNHIGMLNNLLKKIVKDYQTNADVVDWIHMAKSEI